MSTGAAFLSTQRRAHQTSDSAQEGWNPVEFFERILPKWWNERVPTERKANENADQKSHPAHPIITLFFDRDKKMTIAVLSQQDENLAVYFQCRVEQGSAFQRSPLYYELEGFVRENLTKIRRQRIFDSNAISIAMGSLEASDSAQEQELLEEEALEAERIHGHGARTMDEGTFEEVLEIARLHRLNDDLDVLSIYFMRQANKTLGRIAARIAQNRMMKTTLIATPYVDGASTSGYSHFVRDNTRNLVRNSESGRVVEYRMEEQIELSSLSTGNFAPSSHSQFSWKCEEVALANLHRWWGDICIRDYVGQKIVVGWKVGPADAPDYPNSIVPLTALRLEAGPAVGVRKWPLSLASLILHVTESHTVAVDDVTTSYAGCAQVRQVELDFRCLARASARTTIDQIRQKYLKIQETRPLLEHEEEYLRQIEEVASLQ